MGTHYAYSFWARRRSGRDPRWVSVLVGHKTYLLLEATLGPLLVDCPHDVIPAEPARERSRPRGGCTPAHLDKRWCGHFCYGNGHCGNGHYFVVRGVIKFHSVLHPRGSSRLEAQPDSTIPSCKPATTGSWNSLGRRTAHSPTTFCVDSVHGRLRHRSSFLRRCFSLSATGLHAGSLSTRNTARHPSA